MIGGGQRLSEARGNNSRLFWDLVVMSEPRDHHFGRFDSTSKPHLTG